jgi:hypothetical protein
MHAAVIERELRRHLPQHWMHADKDAGRERICCTHGAPSCGVFAQPYRRFGACVTVVEMAGRLIAREDPDVSDAGDP